MKLLTLSILLLCAGASVSAAAAPTDLATIEIGVDPQGCPLPPNGCYSRPAAVQVVAFDTIVLSDTYTLDEWGNASIPLAVENGTELYWYVKPEYTLAHAAHQLIECEEPCNLPVGIYALTADPNNDNRVNIQDFEALREAFDTCDGGPTDFNYDGCTRVADFTLLKRNMGMVGDERWVP